MTEKKSIWKEVLGVLRSGIVKFFVIHLIYIILGLVLFAPLIGMTGQFLLRLSGQEVLSDMDIAMFMLSPSGILALIVLSALLITILIFEKASMMECHKTAWAKYRCDDRAPFYASTCKSYLSFCHKAYHSDLDHHSAISCCQCCYCLGIDHRS